MKAAVHVEILAVMSLVTAAAYAGDIPDEPVPPAVHGEQSIDVDEFERRVRQVENEYGVYHPQLGEALLGLGLVYRSQHKHQRAIGAFEKALHIQRINMGLYNLGQTDIVKLIIESASASRDWNKLGDSLHYLLWIYRRNFKEHKDKLLEELKEVGRLMVDAYRSGTDDIPLSSLVEADDIFNETAGLLEEQQNNREAKVKTLYRVAIVNYRIAHAVSSSRISHREIREAMLEGGREVPDIDEWNVRDHFYDQSFFKGRNAINGIIDIYKGDLPGSAVEYAEALIFLGDWYLVFRQKRNAMPCYAEAYAVLVRNNVPGEKITSLLGAPQPLKTLLLPGEEAARAGADIRYVDAVLDVQDNGWPANIRIIKTNPADDERLQRRGELAVAGVRYRPRFENGEPVETKNVSLQYIFDIQDPGGIYLEQGDDNAFFSRDAINQ